MRRVLPAAALAALLLAPGAAAAERPQADYPDDLAALLPGWVAQVEALAEPHRGKAWFAEAERYLVKARAEAEEGLVRSVVFDLETAQELVRASALMEEANATGASDAQKKTLVLARTREWRDEGEQAWKDFRARLHRMDGQARSLHALETAMYAADVALSAKLGLDGYEAAARAYPATPGFERDAVLDLVRGGATQRLTIGFADAILGAAERREGLPPRAIDGAWANLTAFALRAPADPGPQLRAWEDAAGPVRANGEGIMAVAIALAEQRALRQQGIATTYGDAQSRGRDVLSEATANMGKRLERASMRDVQEHGLLGVFTADAIDQARFVLAFAEEGRTSLPFVVAAWANLDHQEFVGLALAPVSPVDPPAPNNLGEQNNLTRYQEKPAARTPGPQLPAAAAALVAAALALGRRRT